MTWRGGSLDQTITEQRNRAAIEFDFLGSNFREARVSELTLAGLNERIGQELGISDWVAIDQARIDTFASCTGDRRAKCVRLTWAGQRAGCAGGMWLIACSVMAVIVSDGLTPGFAGIAAPSQTSRLR